jgi:cyclase
MNTRVLLPITLTGSLLFPPAVRDARESTQPHALRSVGAPDSGFTLRSLGQGVYATVRNEPLGFINESNSLFIVGDTGVIVVDAQSSSARTRETLAALRTITTKPVRTLINTHWHDDHVVGNEVYAAAFPGLEIIAHTTAPEDLATLGVQFRRSGVAARQQTIDYLRGLITRNQSFLGGPLSAEERRSHELSAWLLDDYSNASADFRPLPPTRTVTDSLTLHLGQREVDILFLGKGHTRGDLVVFLPKERILAAGDLVMWPVPFVGSTSYPAEFARTLQRVRSLNAATVLPGHGKILQAVDANPYIGLVSRVLESIAEQAGAAAGRGDSLAQARTAIKLDDFEIAIAGGDPVRKMLFEYYVRNSAIPRAFEQAKGETPQLEQLVGKWAGMAGTPLDRVEMGLEFKHDSTGRLAAFLYSPVANFYGLPLGPVTVDSGRFKVHSWLTLTLERAGDTLRGPLFFNRVPMTLTRASSLPSEVPVPSLPAGPGPSWQLKLGAPIYAEAALRDGIAYVGTSGGMFHAIDATSGSFRWSFAAGRPTFGAAQVTDSAVYFVCDNGFLFKLRRRDGTEIWRYDLGDDRTPRMLMHQVIDKSGDFDWDMSAPTPVIAGDTIYVGSGDGSMHAVDAVTGTRIWRFQSKGKVRGTAVLDGDRVVFGTFDGLVVALDRHGGTKLWEWDSHGPVVTSVALVGDRIVVGNRYGVLAAVNDSSGKLAWAMQLWGSSAESEATPAGGSLFYFGSSDLRRVALMDATDGRVVWRTDVFGWAWPRPVIDGDVLLVSTVGAEPYQIRQLGALVAMDRSTGKILWRWPMPQLTWRVGVRVLCAGGRRRSPHRRRRPGRHPLRLSRSLRRAGRASPHGRG